MAEIILEDLEDLERLGKILASCLPRHALPPLFLYGELGAGKTTLVKAIVRNLEGSEEAEVGSPSFNIYNFYPTKPPIYHGDLYRCGANLPEELLASLEEREEQLILEWAEFFPSEKYPENYLDISFNLFKNERLLKLIAHGYNAQLLLDEILSLWKP